MRLATLGAPWPAAGVAVQRNCPVAQARANNAGHAALAENFDRFACRMGSSQVNGIAGKLELFQADRRIFYNNPSKDWAASIFAATQTKFATAITIGIMDDRHQQRHCARGCTGPIFATHPCLVAASPTRGSAVR